VDEGLEKCDQAANAQLVLAWKRRNKIHVVIAVGNKDGINEHRLDSAQVSDLLIR
jgi:hypothetical protein